MGLDAFVTAGLYDPDGPDAAGRAELLEHLVARFGEAPVLEAAGRLPLFTVAVELSDPPPRRISARAVATAAGASLDDVVVLRAAQGFPVTDPDAPDIPDFQVEDIAVAQAGIELFGYERTLAFTRVVGGAVQQISEAARSLFASSVAEDAGERGPTELELSIENETAWAAWCALPAVVGHLMIERGDASQALVTEILAGPLMRAVAFVDLVGSTAWAITTDPLLHGAALARFEQAAWEVATRRGGRLVKLIGDEAMVVAEHATAACTIAVELLALAKADPDLPEARAGVALGEVVARSGDYYGQTVNLAARLVALAPPSGLVTTTAVASTLDPASWTAEPLGAVELRGVPDPVELTRLRPSATRR
jgi:class 3 adenylate cyclase